MREHTKVYMNHFEYGESDFIQCEILGVRANDIHHIECRGAGGTTKEENIDNLMALDRVVHLIYGDKQIHMDFLTVAHQRFLRDQTPYIRVNPYHESFEELIGTGYEDYLMTARRKEDELKKYRV